MLLLVSCGRPVDAQRTRRGAGRRSPAYVPDVGCVFALYTMLGKLKAKAPDADLIVTEENFDATTYPRAAVYSTLAALLTYGAGGVAYKPFGNNSYDHTGDRYELFDGLTPVPLVSDLAAPSRPPARSPSRRAARTTSTST